VSGAGIIGISVTLLAVSAKNDGELRQSSRLVFNALLPLLATWVGMVLAYYFSRKNFETASQSVERMVSLTVERDQRPTGLLEPQTASPTAPAQKIMRLDRLSPRA
jgi:hypothetical protein